MADGTYPVAAAFAVLLIFLFVVLLITWCCKQCTRPKDHSITLIPQPVPHHHRYIRTIDVQTGLPVVVDLEAIANSRNQLRNMAGRRPIPHSTNTNNTQGNGTLYGSIGRDPHELTESMEAMSRTPPPPYSGVVLR